VYIQIRDSVGAERFIEEEQLESCIATGDIVAFRRSDGWITVPLASHRGKLQSKISFYSGQERRRSVLSKKRMLPETDGS
jgi:hypothetical protein